MQFLRILFWCLLSFLAAVFTLGNWTTVTIHLWGGMLAETNLPLLLLIVFLVGLLPTLIVQHAARWRLRQRLTAAEHQLADLLALPITPAAATPVVATPAHPAVAVSPVAKDGDSAAQPGAPL